MWPHNASCVWYVTIHCSWPLCDQSLTPCQEPGCDVPSNWHHTTLHYTGCTGDLTRDRFLPITHQAPDSSKCWQYSWSTDSLNNETILIWWAHMFTQLSFLYSVWEERRVVTSPPLVNFLMECGPGHTRHTRPAGHGQREWEWSLKPIMSSVRRKPSKETKKGNQSQV